MDDAFYDKIQEIYYFFYHYSKEKPREYGYLELTEDEKDKLISSISYVYKTYQEIDESSKEYIKFKKDIESYQKQYKIDKCKGYIAYILDHYLKKDSIDYKFLYAVKTCKESGVFWRNYYAIKH